MMGRQRSLHRLTTEPLPEAIDVIERYVDWREAAAAAGAAYADWSGAERGERSLAFGMYTAALDQEESAASRYSRAMNQLRRHLASTGAAPAGAPA